MGLLVQVDHWLGDDALDSDVCVIDACRHAHDGARKTGESSDDRS